MKINRLEIENVKRVKAVALEPAADGLTVIGGRNNQGKTSVLDAIAWALGGEKYRPSEAVREESVTPPYIRIVMDSGLVVERKGKNSSLTITDPEGRKGGQQLLNAFVEQLALDLPRFLQASARDKAEILLRILGIGDRLYAMEAEESRLYNERLAVGRIADQKKKFAAEQPSFPGVPSTPLTATELILRQQEILAKNGENQRKRRRAKELLEEKQALQKKLEEMQLRYDQVCRDCELAQRSAVELQDESTAELEQSIAHIEELNRKIRANLDKERAEEDAKTYEIEYDSLTARIERLRADRLKLLCDAELPLAGLSVEQGELKYKGRSWDCMSGSEQLKVAAAIVRKLKPACGFVLLDKLEQMDGQTLAEFGAWLEEEGLQAIATRVSTSGECSIIIEDGLVAESKPAWKAGEF